MSTLTFGNGRALWHNQMTQRFHFRKNHLYIFSIGTNTVSQSWQVYRGQETIFRLLQSLTVKHPLTIIGHRVGTPSRGISKKARQIWQRRLVLDFSGLWEELELEALTLRGFSEPFAIHEIILLNITRLLSANLNKEMINYLRIHVDRISLILSPAFISPNLRSTLWFIRY